MSRETVWRKYCWLFEKSSDFGREIFAFAVENLQDCCQISTICFQMANWKNISAKNFAFFADVQGTFFGFFCWIILGMVVKTAFFMPKRTYALRKIFWQNFFYLFRTKRDIFLNFHWNVWCLIVKTTVYVFRRALWEGFRILREFFKLSLNYFRLDCQKYSLRVQRSTLRKVRCSILGMVVQTEFHKPRRTYPLGKILWENFLSFPDYERNFLNIHWSLLGMLSKLQFTCS